jgi:hypothetical protein
MRRNREPENQTLANDICDSRAGEAAMANLVEEPVKVIRIGRMLLQLLDEVRSASLDDAARARLSEIHERSVKELQDSLPPELAEELCRIWVPVSGGSQASGEEVRVGQAQLAGWLEGLVHNIQATIAQQQALTRYLSPGIPGRVFPMNAVIIPGSILSNNALQHGIAGPKDPCAGASPAGADAPPGQYL